MNANGARFHLLLGRDDWGRCLDGDCARTLAAAWAGEPGPPSARPLPAWDAGRAELGLAPLAIELPRTPGEAPLMRQARRGAAADRHGNVYRVGDDGRTLHAAPAGTRADTVFWPIREKNAERARLDFRPAAEAATPDERYLALAVTGDDLLVVAYADGAARGFLRFDLVSGGPPARTPWPAGVPLEPVDMAPRRCGGVWVLDGAGRPVLWALDRGLGVVALEAPGPAATAEPDDFQPLAGPARDRAPAALPGGMELAGARGWAADPVALEAAGDGVLLLDLDAAGARTRVVRLRREGGAWRADASRWLDELPEPGHDFVLAAAPLYGRAEPARLLFIATRGGNQARGYALEDAADGFALRGATELFPLRRFGGRALLSVRGAATYDSGADAPAWTPVVHQPRARFAPVAELVTPVFDGGEPGTVWDRLLLDGCVPPGTVVQVQSRAGDECTGPADAEGAQVIGSWLPEPRPRLRAGGPELPWLRAEAAGETRREAGAGTWELLLQRAHGRYLQLRITLSTGGGTATPRLRALRVWWPRFSWPQRFLPAVYREDEVSGSLLERWLANCEGTLTAIEDRVASAQLLFDPRTAPAGALAWLAEWLDLALDPEWDEGRRRVFIAHAMEFFRWRGTVHGLSMALEAAFGACVDPALFQAPGTRAAAPRGIRIVEAYQARRIGALAAGDPGAAAGLREVPRQPRWTPAEGNAGLADRWAAWRGRDGATPVEEITPVPLVPPAGADAARWSEFAGAALGFVPAAGAAERARWQAFLRARYGGAEELRAAYGADAGESADPPLPRDWPADSQRADDWREFCARAEWTRGRWHDFLARRHRRVERLNRAWGTSWPGFGVVALPDALPGTPAAQGDWLQFEGQVLAMHRTAHRFSVLLPVRDVAADPWTLQARLGLARRIVEMEKPAHTVFDVRYYWAFFRTGAARLGLDTQLGAGSRAPELVPAAVLGRAYVGASFVGADRPPGGGGRLSIAC
jgi:phage tail-like protein